jgi:hypothetical protein
LILNENPIDLFERNCHATEKSEAMHVKGYDGHPSGGHKKNNRKKLRAKEERHKGSLTPKILMQCQETINCMYT